jgi:hypothetical protein
MRTTGRAKSGRKLGRWQSNTVAGEHWVHLPSGNRSRPSSTGVQGFTERGEHRFGRARTLCQIEWPGRYQRIPFTNYTNMSKMSTTNSYIDNIIGVISSIYRSRMPDDTPPAGNWRLS